MTRPEDEAFLSRWSRRKLENRHEAEGDPLVEAPADLPPDDPEADDVARRELEEARALTEDDVEQLTSDSDFSIFMRKGVAPHVKKLALRKLWRSDPVLANLDGLNDYDGDFTDAATSMKHFASTWKVGKGYEVATPPAADAATEPVQVADDAIRPAEEDTGEVAAAVEAAEEPEEGGTEADGEKDDGTALG